MNINGTNDFSDFLMTYPRYSKYSNNLVAKQIFDLLSELTNIQKMFIASQTDKPALSACVQELEANYGNQAIFDLNNDFTKQAIGSMVKVILDPFGYKPVKQKRMPATISKYFTSASVYHISHQPKLEIIQKLEIQKIDDSI